MHRVVAKGRVYFYHRPTKTRLRAPYGTAQFLLEVEALDRRSEAKRPLAGSVGALVRAYRGSPEYDRLAPNTKRFYDWYLDRLEEAYDAMPVAKVDTAFVIGLRDKVYEDHHLRRSTGILQVISLLWNWGRLRNLTRENPAASIPRIKRPKGSKKRNRRWRETEVGAALDRLHPTIRLAVGLGVATSLRLSDVLSLPWAAYNGDAIDTNQGKTGDPVWLPVLPWLKEMLDEAPREGATMIVSERGTPYNIKGWYSAWYREIKPLQREGLLGPGITFHGLRHTLATALAERGATTRQIMSVTGHRDEAQVATYVRDAERKVGAKAAMALMPTVKPAVKPAASD